MKCNFIRQIWRRYETVQSGPIIMNIKSLLYFEKQIEIRFRYGVPSVHYYLSDLESAWGLTLPIHYTTKSVGDVHPTSPLSPSWAVPDSSCCSSTSPRTTLARVFHLSDLVGEWEAGLRSVSWVEECLRPPVASLSLGSPNTVEVEYLLIDWNRELEWRRLKNSEAELFLLPFSIVSGNSQKPICVIWVCVPSVRRQSNRPHQFNSFQD